jgi:multidrug efflux pump subunit AcrA (membrane-fusion protein)
MARLHNAERQRDETAEAAHNALVAAERQRDEMIAAAEQALSDVRQRDQELQVLRNQRNAARSPAPDATLYNEEGVPGGGEEDEDGGGEELPRMSSRDASYAAAAADGQIPNAIGPLARVIERDPRWGKDRRGDFEDTPNIESIQRRRYNRSAGNVLYETNFPIGQFASVRVPMPRGTPQTLALFGRNAHVATPAQSINRAIMRYEGRGVYR